MNLLFLSDSKPVAGRYVGLMSLFFLSVCICVYLYIYVDTRFGE